MRNKIANWVKSTTLYKYLYPIYTQEYTDHPTEQFKEIKCYKNGEYTHTVNLHYFTNEEIEKFQNITDSKRSRNMSRNNNRKRYKRKNRRKINR